MSNMSYCRFENTNRDLADCESALEDLIAGDADEALSASELRAAEDLIERCFNIVSMIAERSGKDVEDLIDGNTNREIKAVLAATMEQY